MSAESGAVASGAGMRGKDLKKILMVAREFHVIILVRHTNKLSLPYVGEPGFYPKPIFLKAKTADMSMSASGAAGSGRSASLMYEIGGLVVHPGIQPGCFKREKEAKAQKAWADTIEHLDAGLASKRVDPASATSLEPWGREHEGSGIAKGWKWRIDVDPNSTRFGCLQLRNGNRNPALPWSYIHGDYDLKDVIVPGRETENRRKGYQLAEGVWNWTPILHGIEFEDVRRRINELIAVPMVQHGAEAQFAWHGDEDPITIAFPDWTFLILGNAEAVQGWYEQRHRATRGKKGTDYLRDESRMFQFDAETGGWRPGKRPGETARS